jgi:hypothetical protein
MLKKVLIPAEKTSQVVRPELNIEKWSPFWQPAQSRSQPKIKILERKKLLQNGGIELSRVEVSPSLKHGNLTTEDQKVWYGVLILWEKAGKPEELTFSLRKLVEVLERNWCYRTYEAIKKSLGRLNATSFNWINSYHDSTTKKTLEVLDSFHILADLQIAKVSQGSSINTAKCFCRFGKVLYQNLMNTYTRPTFFSIVIKLKSGVAQLLYKYLEFVMQKREDYEETSKKVFEKLGLEGEAYKQASKRKQILETAQKELNTILKDADGREQGFPIPNGILFLKLEKTKDGSDWKVIIRKNAQIILPAIEASYQPEEDEEAPTIVIEVKEAGTKSKHPDKQPKETPQINLPLAQQIVLYFFQKFHIRRQKPLKREILTAQEWIEEYNLDLEKGQILVNWSKGWAAETNFNIQNFAGLALYLDRALEKIKQIETTRQTENCKLCDFDGKVNCKEASDRYFLWNCPHNLEQIQNYANTYKVNIQLNSGTILVPS